MTIPQAFRVCAVAMVIGAILAAPVIAWRAPKLFLDSIAFASLPTNDESLEAWLIECENVLELEVYRTQQSLRVKYVRQGLMAERLAPDWTDLGYGRLRRQESSEGISFAKMFQDHWILLGMLGCSQLGFLIMGVRVRKRLSADVLQSQPQPKRAMKSGVALGFAAGVLMICTGFLYDLLLYVLAVDFRTAAGPWAAISEMPFVAFAALLLSASIFVPICEELFFRGAILHGFQVAGAARTGVLMSSILFTFVHFDLINMPVLILSGVILAVLHLKTGRLLPCVVAHGLNNAVALTYLRLWS